VESLLLGFIVSFLLIYLANNNIVHPILLAWSIQIFVYEFTSINLIRLKNKKDPFVAGLDHFTPCINQKKLSQFFFNKSYNVHKQI
jgi:UDP-N-acetylmuramyl pentapeptide phosphotransferase/UDP-N-acetylglucosamine-1-phosphate transferase